MSRYFKLGFFIFMSALFCFNCNQRGRTLEIDKTTDTELIPVLQTMKIHGVLVENKKVRLPYEITSVKTENVEATFDISNVQFSLKDEEVQLEVGKETVLIISVDSVKGKYKGFDIEIKVTREVKQDAQLEVKLIEAKGGVDEWGSYFYQSLYPLEYNSTTKYWEGNKPMNSDVMAFKVKVDKKDVDASRITARIFQGTLKDAVVLYDIEKTKAPLIGVLSGTELVFDFDHNSCNQISIRDYYKVDISIDGNTEISAFIKLR